MTYARRTYVATAAGWVAGVRVAEGQEISLTPAEARYENVELKADRQARLKPRVEKIGSLDGPLVRKPSRKKRGTGA